MMEDESNNNFVELLVYVNSTLQCHPRFSETAEFRIVRHDIEEMLLKLAIGVEQTYVDLSQLKNDKVVGATLENFMKMIVEYKVDIMKMLGD